MVPNLRGRRLVAGVAPGLVSELEVRFRGSVRAQGGQAPGIRPEKVLPWPAGEASGTKPLSLAFRSPELRSTCPRFLATTSRGSLRLRCGGHACGAPLGRGGRFRGFPYNNAFETHRVKPSRGSWPGGRGPQGRRYRASVKV